MKLLEWLGAIAGIIGASLMAANLAWSGWAYPIWLVSSISLSAFGWLGGYYALLALQAVFTIVNLLGAYNWLM